MYMLIFSITYIHVYVHVISEPEQLPVYATHEEAKQAFKELLKEKVCGIVHTCTCSTVVAQLSMCTCSAIYFSAYMCIIYNVHVCVCTCSAIYFSVYMYMCIIYMYVYVHVVRYTSVYTCTCALSTCTCALSTCMCTYM